MAYYTDTINAPAPKASFLARLGRGLRSWFEAVAEARGRAAEFETLNAKSDAELAAMGLTRADIPRYVWRDMIHV